MNSRLSLRESSASVTDRCLNATTAADPARVQIFANIARVGGVYRDLSHCGISYQNATFAGERRLSTKLQGCDYHLWCCLNINPRSNYAPMRCD